MNPNSEIFSIILALIILISAIFVFIWLTLRIRRGGGSMTTIAMGATDEFLTKEKKKSAETIVNQKAGKNFKKQTSASDSD
jgi:hypothetical protein